MSKISACFDLHSVLRFAWKNKEGAGAKNLESSGDVFDIQN